MAEKSGSSEAVQEIERLRKEIKTLKEDIAHSYYRIPKEEFENVTVKKITMDVNSQVQSRINGMRNVVGLILLTLSFFGISQWSKVSESMQKEILNNIQRDVNGMKLELSSNIDAKLSSIEDRLQDSQDLIKENQNKMQGFLNKEIESITKTIDIRASRAAKQETESQLETVREDMRSAQKTVMKTELNALRKDVDDRFISYKEALLKMDPLFQRALLLNDKDLANEFLDDLFRWTFLSNKYEDLDQLRLKYEKEYDFKHTTWANIAIGGMFLYEESFSPIYKKRAVSAYQQSLERVPNYGLPHAVRLIIHMIDVARSDDEKVKEEEKDNILKLIHHINAGSRSVTAYETYNYLDKLRNDRGVGKHISMLFSGFPDPMNEMRLKYEAHLQLLENR